MFDFGSGVLLASSTTLANPSGLNFGLLQEVSTDLSFDTKMLYGQYQFPVALGRGKAKFSAKAKMARISGLVMANLFLGVAPTVGELLTSFGETGTIPASSTYTVQAAQHSTFVDDYGVVYATTGLPFVKVASLTAVGQYTESAGTFTFYSGDAGVAVLLNYTYTVTTAGTQQVAITNQLMGSTPTFQCQLYGGSFGGVPFNMKLYNCVCNKIGLATKLDDFMVPEIDFDILANSAGNVGLLSFGEVS